MVIYEELLDWLNKNPTIQSLRKKAKELGVKIKKRMKKREILKLLKDEVLKRMETESRSTASSKIERTFEEVSEIKVTGEPELPKSYEKDKLVLLPVNPYWLHAYWDLSPQTIREIESLPEGSQVILRLHDVTYIIFDGNNANRTFEVSVDVRFTKNYYFNIPTPGADFILELGYRTPDGKLVILMRSNVCKAPKNSPSQSFRERWMDLRSRKKRVIMGKGSIVKPVEKVTGASGGIISRQISSGGGAFIWERIRSGMGKGGF